MPHRIRDQAKKQLVTQDGLDEETGAIFEQVLWDQFGSQPRIHRQKISCVRQWLVKPSNANTIKEVNNRQGDGYNGVKEIIMSICDNKPVTLSSVGNISAPNFQEGQSVTLPPAVVPEYCAGSSLMSTGMEFSGLQASDTNRDGVLPEHAPTHFGREDVLQANDYSAAVPILPSATPSQESDASIGAMVDPAGTVGTPTDRVSSQQKEVDTSLSLPRDLSQNRDASRFVPTDFARSPEIPPSQENSSRLEDLKPQSSSANNLVFLPLDSNDQHRQKCDTLDRATDQQQEASGDFNISCDIKEEKHVPIPMPEAAAMTQLSRERSGAPQTEIASIRPSPSISRSVNVSEDNPKITANPQYGVKSMSASVGGSQHLDEALEMKTKDAVTSIYKYKVVIPDTIRMLNEAREMTLFQSVELKKDSEARCIEQSLQKQMTKSRELTSIIAGLEVQIRTMTNFISRSAELTGGGAKQSQSTNENSNASMANFLTNLDSASYELLNTLSSYHDEIRTFRENLEENATCASASQSVASIGCIDRIREAGADLISDIESFVVNL